MIPEATLTIQCQFLVRPKPVGIAVLINKSCVAGVVLEDFIKIAKEVDALEEARDGDPFGIRALKNSLLYFGEKAETAEKEVERLKAVVTQVAERLALMSAEKAGNTKSVRAKLLKLAKSTKEQLVPKKEEPVNPVEENTSDNSEGNES